MQKTTSKENDLGKTNESQQEFEAWQNKCLGFTFRNTHLLLQSLTHTSYSHEQTNESSNERLEFLGDAVLQLIVTEKLFELFSDLKEGELSKLRGSLVNENTLCELARVLEINLWMRLGKGESKEDGATRPSLLSDTLEAILGAIYLERGYSEAQKVFLTWVEHYEEKLDRLFFDELRLDSFDAKSRLQEETMKLYQSLPDYRCEENESGFSCELFINNKLVAKDEAKSKKKLMKNLAAKVLEEKKYLGL